EAFFNSIFATDKYEENKVINFSETTDLFKLCCDNYGETSGKRRQFSFINTLLLYGILQYLQNKDSITEKEFAERIRIVRNVALNSTDETRETRLTALLSDTFHIIKFGEVQLKSGGFNETQKNE